MDKIWTIFKWEYSQVVRKKSFIVGLLLTPAFIILVTVIPRLMADRESTRTERLAVVDKSGTGIGTAFAETVAEYTIGDTDIPYYEITAIIDLPPGQADQEKSLMDSLNAEINAEQIKYFLVIESGDVTKDSIFYLVTNTDDIKTIDRFQEKLSGIVAKRRLEMSSVNLSVDSVMALTRQLDLLLRNTKGETVSLQVKFFIAFGFIMMMYMMIVTYGMQVMRSVIEEKTTRIMEVLVSSITPFQLMMGKILGLAGATFTAILAWVVMGGLFFMFSGALAIPVDPGAASIFFNPVVVTAFIAFMLLGYLFYSTLFALLGSVVTTEKEAQNFIFPLVISLMVPVFIGSRIMQEPNSMLAVVLSYIPFFAPTMMMMRVVFLAPSATSYSLFSGVLMEMILGIIAISIGIVLIVWLTSRIFRVGILMYGKRATLAEVIKWVKY